ncbi:MAG TPA: hypothetical protein VGL89_08130 [Candidatus Koribacter sp.]
MRRWLRDPLLLLVLIAALTAIAVQSGEVGTSDTMHRLQSTHSFWTHEPPVFPNEYPEFGVHGRDGKLQSWYGIGQSLLMLPADIIGTGIENLHIFDSYRGTDPTIRDIVVTYTTNTLIAVLTVLVCFRFLRQLRFTVKQTAIGVLALFFATTHLHYTQNMMENNYIFLLTLTGFSFFYEWTETGGRRALFIGAGAFGLNLLTRLTTGLDLIAGCLFALLVLWMHGADLRGKFRQFVTTAVPVVAIFVFLDRLYQFYRFGAWFTTYLGLMAQETKQRDPSLPANFPFSTSFHQGFFGALFAPEKSVFLFDPLLVLTILLALFAWKRFSREAKAYVVVTALLLLADLSFYARYYSWSGDFAWGDRYVSTAAELAVLLAVPLMLRHRTEIGPLFSVGIVIVVISTLIQVESLAFWMPLEIYQEEKFGHPTWVIWLRLTNIVAFALGKFDAWGLNTPAMSEDPWDYVHISCWNFLPFLLKRVGETPAWVVRLTTTLWLLCVAGLMAALWRLRNVLKSAETASS